MNTIYLGLGSNIGNRVQYIQRAIAALSRHHQITIQLISRLYDNPAISHDHQPNYMNSVVKGTTSLTPMTLLSVTQTIEKELGRTNKNTGQSRVIDIDILLYNSLIMANDQLIIPHPLLHERYFVLRPLNDISPHCIHPVFNQSIRDLWHQYQNQSIDTLLNPNE